MKRLLKKMSNQNGDVIIESTIVLSIVIVFIFFLMMLGFYMFQQMSINIIANDTAATIASISSHKEKDPIEGYISKSDYTETSNLYRYISNDFVNLFGGIDHRENRAKWYAYYTLDGYQYIAPSKEPTVTVDVDMVSPFKSQIKVKIEAEYEFPLVSTLMAMLGDSDDGKIKVVATGYAVCNDMSEYVSRVLLYCDLTDALTNTGAYQGFNNNISGIIEDIKKIIGMIKDV